jgi:hypothetical protein
VHASLDRQSVPWEGVIAIDGAVLPAPLAEDPRVRTLVLPRPVGAACARNLALNEVRTEFCNWADDDDEFTDDAMAVRLRVIKETGVGWCAGYSLDLHPDVVRPAEALGGRRPGIERSGHVRDGTSDRASVHSIGCCDRPVVETLIDHRGAEG